MRRGDFKKGVLFEFTQPTRLFATSGTGINQVLGQIRTEEAGTFEVVDIDETHLILEVEWQGKKWDTKFPLEAIA